MLKNLVASRNPQSTIVSVFSAVMLSSLVCGLSVQQCHAGEIIAESAEQTEPLRTGERAPSFVVRNADNEEFAFDPDSLQRPVVLIAFRGGWCPFCNMHLSELRTVVPVISSMGIDVLFLSGDRPDMLYTSLAADTQENIADLDYQIYSDAEANAAIALGIAYKVPEDAINLRKQNGDDIEDSSMLKHGVLPVPAVYAIDESGLIRFDFVSPSFTVRLPAEELLAVAEELVQ